MVTEAEIILVAELSVLAFAASIIAIILQNIFPDNILLINYVAGGTVALLTFLTIRPVNNKDI